MGRPVIEPPSKFHPSISPQMDIRILRMLTYAKRKGPSLSGT
jgi:hypothetical protein